MPQLMLLMLALLALAVGACIGGLFWPTRKLVKFLVILAVAISLVSVQPQLAGTWAGSLWLGFATLSFIGILSL